MFRFNWCQWISQAEEAGSRVRKWGGSVAHDQWFFSFLYFSGHLVLEFIELYQ